MGKFAAVNDRIIEETHALALAYRDRYAGDTVGELRAWLEVAARREAMVREVYGVGQRELRLAPSTCDAELVAWDALTTIWQQEAVHTELIRVHLADGVTADGGGLEPNVAKWIGELEGKLLCTLTGDRPTLGRALAGFAAQIAASVAPSAVPPFATELRGMNTKQFFALAAALETTAKQSYARMTELVREWLAARSREERPASARLKNLYRDLYRTRMDEEFHESAFGLMATWMDEDGLFEAALGEHACAQAIADLLPPAPTFRDSDRGMAIGDVRSGFVLTDGGLGAFFQRHGVRVAVARVV